MLTLSSIVLVWFLTSTYRLKKLSIKNKEDFNPFNGGFVDYVGFIVGLTLITTFVLFIIVNYLP